MGLDTLGSVVIPQRDSHVPLNLTVWSRVSGTPSRANEVSDHKELPKIKLLHKRRIKTKPRNYSLNIFGILGL